MTEHFSKQIFDDLKQYTSTKSLIIAYDMQIEALLNPYQSPTWEEKSGHSDSGRSITERVFDEREDLTQRRDELIAINKRVDAFVRSVEDSDRYTGAILRMRFIDGKTWKEVAWKCCNSPNKETAIMEFKRFRDKF